MTGLRYGGDTNGITRAAFLTRAVAGATGALSALCLPPARAADRPLLARRIPSSGEALPVVGLGTALSFGSAPDETAFAARKAAIEALLSGGGAVIDTSPTYGDAEAIVGRALAEIGGRGRAFVATKISTTGERAGIEQHRRSVENLRAARIDLLQIHNLRDTATHLATVRRLKDEGRVRYVGITHFRPSAYDRVAEVIRAEKLDFVQIGYSMVMRDAERVLLPLARDRGVAVLVNVPYARGRLFSLVRGRPLPEWAAEFDAVSWGQFFLKFLLAHEAVTAVIPGAVQVRHVRDNLGAGRGRLPTEVQRRRMVDLFDSL